MPWLFAAAARFDRLQSRTSRSFTTTHAHSLFSLVHLLTSIFLVLTSNENLKFNAQENKKTMQVLEREERGEYVRQAGRQAGSVGEWWPLDGDGCGGGGANTRQSKRLKMLCCSRFKAKLVGREQRNRARRIEWIAERWEIRWEK